MLAYVGYALNNDAQVQPHQTTTKNIKQHADYYQSLLPEFNVQAFQNGEFKTVTKRRCKRQMGRFLLLSSRLHFRMPYRLVDLAEKYEELKKMGVEVYSVSTDSHFTHKAWHDASDSIKKITYPCSQTPRAY